MAKEEQKKEENQNDLKGEDLTPIKAQESSNGTSDKHNAEVQSGIELGETNTETGNASHSGTITLSKSDPEGVLETLINELDKGNQTGKYDVVIQHLEVAKKFIKLM